MRDPSEQPTLSPAVRARLEHLLAPDEVEAPRRAVVAEPEPEPAAETDEPPPLPQLAWARAREFGRRHVAAIALLVAAGVGFGVWNLFHARSVEVSPTPRSVVAGTPGRTSSPGGSASATTVVVHVVGAVQRPGVVSLSSGARVSDAIAAAGGLAGEADPGQLNLAAPLSDGEQIVIGTRANPTGEVRAGASSVGAASPETQQVNLNTATQAQLEALPGVGPVTAGKIVAWRTEHGRFTRVEELGEVDGIGPKTFAQLKPHVRV